MMVSRRTLLARLAGATVVLGIMGVVGRTTPAVASSGGDGRGNERHDRRRHERPHHRHDRREHHN